MAGRFFTLGDFRLIAVSGSGETELILKETALLLGSGVAGGRATLAMEGTALTQLFRVPHLRRLAWGVGTIVLLCPRRM
jgi:hypothetical protein